MSFTQLNELLSQCSSLLKSVGESFWSKKIDGVVASENPSLSTRSILEWYGGMGSFSDLMICRINGHDVSLEEEPEINKKLSSLRTRIYEEVDALVRSGGSNQGCEVAQ